MKAAVFEDIEKILIKEVPDPKCDPDGLVLKIKACAICGTDIKIYHAGHRHIRPPRITGHELCGEIVEVGKNLKNYNAGQRVAVAPAVPCGDCYSCRKAIFGMCDNLAPIGYQFDGGFAEYMAVPPIAVRTTCVNLVPDNVSDEEAALAEPLACAINGQELSGVGLGHTVLIIGSGPLGCIHTRLARANGATTTIMADISAERLEMAKAAGADRYVNSAEEDLAAVINEITDGHGADVIITACSSGKAQEQAVTLVAKRGNVNFFGGLPKGNSIINIDSNLLHYKEFSITGTHGSSPDNNRTAIRLIAGGGIEVKDLISKTMPLEKLVEGIADAETGKFMKIIIKP